jgi:SRSO17 transposase
VTRGVVLADAAYGNDSEFRGVLDELGLQYVVGVQSSMTVWEPGKQPLPASHEERWDDLRGYCNALGTITPSR